MLRESAAELERVISLRTPTVDDGIVTNTAPLFRLRPHWGSRAKADAAWKELCDDDLGWSLMTNRFWPELMLPKCAKDRSLAIAREIQDVFWVEGTDSKWIDLWTPTRGINELAKERTAPAVKSALQNPIDAPAALSAAKKTRRGRRNA